MSISFSSSPFFEFIQIPRTLELHSFVAMSFVLSFDVIPSSCFSNDHLTFQITCRSFSRELTWTRVYRVCHGECCVWLVPVKIERSSRMHFVSKIDKEKSSLREGSLRLFVSSQTRLCIDFVTLSIIVDSSWISASPLESRALMYSSILFLDTEIHSLCKSIRATSTYVVFHSRHSSSFSVSSIWAYFFSSFDFPVWSPACRRLSRYCVPSFSLSAVSSNDIRWMNFNTSLSISSSVIGSVLLSARIASDFENATLFCASNSWKYGYL